MDLASLIGLVAGFIMVIFGIIVGGGEISSFIDPPSVVITILGSLTSVMSSRKLPEFLGGFGGLGIAIKEPEQGDPTEVIKSIIDMANIARKEGLLALEETANGIEDAFLKKGIMLVVDGTDADLVRAILETDLDAMETRHKRAISFWDKWGEMGPAWGMIGTLIGLVNMLKNLSDPSTIGPSMAVALLTTLYGSLIANWLTGPVSAKLAEDNDMEVTVRIVAIEGLLSIQAGENPHVIEEKLKCFLPPSARDAIGGDAGGGE